MADGASYQIAIDAKTVGADASAAQLTALADQIRSAAAVATSFDGAIAAATSALNQAKSEAASAADALGAGEAKYNSLEAAANKAARAVEAAAAKGKDTTALQASADSAAAAMTAQGAAVDQLRAKAQEAAAAQQELASALATLQGAARSEASATKAAAMKAEAAAAKEAAAALKEKAAAEAESGSAASGSIPGVLGAGGALDAVAPKSMSAAKTLKSLKFAMKGAGLEGTGTVGRIGALVKGLGALGVAGVAAIAVLAVVGVAVSVFAGFLSVAKFALTSNKKAMDAINKSTEKWKKNLGKLFSGLNFKPFLKAFDEVADVFNETSSSGKALKSLMTTIFQPMYDAAAAVLPYVKVFLKGVVAGLLDMAIAAVEVYISIKSMIPPEVLSAVSAVIASMGGMDSAFSAGIAVIKVVAVVIGVAVVACAALAVIIGGVLVASIAVAVALFAMWPAIFAVVVGAAIWLGKKLVDALGGLGELASGALDAASSMISGLVSGIMSGAGAVADAMRSLAKGAIDAFKSAIGYGSPAKAYIEIAKTGIGGGLAEGADQSQSMVDKAIGDLSTPPSELNVKSSGATDPFHAAAGGRSTSTTGSTITIGSVVLNAKTDDPEGFAEAFIRFCELQLVTVGGT